MAKQKVQPNGILDFLSPQEFIDGLSRQNDTLTHLLGRNARFIRHIAQALVASDSSFEIRVTPPDGFMWEVKGIIFSGTLNGINSGQALVYINDPNSIVNQIGQITTGLTTYSSKTLIMHSTDDLIFVQIPGTTIDPGTQASVQLFVVEVPNSHEAALLL